MLKVYQDRESGNLLCPDCESDNVYVQVEVGTVLLWPFVLPSGEIRFLSSREVLNDCEVIGLTCADCGWEHEGEAWASPESEEG